MKRTFNALTLVGLTLILGLLPSCGGGGKPNPNYDEAARCYAADESLSPIMDEELNAFYQKTHKGPLYALYISETEAIEKLLNQDVFLAFTTRRLTQAEENVIKNKQYNPRTFPLAYDAMALIVNNENTDTIMLVENFKKILTGEVTTWKELYPDSPFDTIRVAFDNPKSATVRFCVDSILRGEQMKTSGNIRAVETSKQVMDYVERHKDAIGIIGSNWLDDKRDETNTIFNRNVTVMRVGKTPLNAVQPYQYYIATGEYPFIRTIYALCTDPRSTGVPRAFANFCWLPEPGQRIFFRAGFFPARAEYELRDVVIR
jgi:phosphate transport system substrate-binding protein